MFCYLHSERACFCCPLWALTIKVMTAINSHPEGKYFCQCSDASPAFTSSVGTACTLDKVSHRGQALISIASCVITDIMSIKKI